MAKIIDFFKAVHEMQRPRDFPWNSYDVHFIDPSGNCRVWCIDAPDESAARDQINMINGHPCEITQIRLIGYSRAGTRR